MRSRNTEMKEKKRLEDVQSGVTSKEVEAGNSSRTLSIKRNKYQEHGRGLI